MRVLLTLHHPLDPNLGAPGATLALGAALQDVGCRVEYYGFQEAFGNTREGVRRALQFPWRLAGFLRRHGSEFDIVDASTGDGWVWAARGRVGAKPGSGFVTRSHGLEHVLDSVLRASGERLSWKYPFYHGGFRLWEVGQSLRRADHCVLLNRSDRDYVATRLGVPRERLSVMPTGIAELFQDLPAANPPLDATLRLAFVGSWIARKGTAAVINAATRLEAEEIDFSLTLLGTGVAEDAIREEFPPAVRKRVHVTPRYQAKDLPGLLAMQEVLLFPSLSEGFSRALIEAMACGLAPIATPVGGAPDVIEAEVNGKLVPAGDGAALAKAIKELVSDRDALLQMRMKAQETAAAYRWDAVAAQTIALYERVVRERTA